MESKTTHGKTHLPFRVLNPKWTIDNLWASHHPHPHKALLQQPQLQSVKDERRTAQQLTRDSVPVSLDMNLLRLRAEKKAE